MDRACVSGAQGRRFESCRGCQNDCRRRERRLEDEGLGRCPGPFFVGGRGRGFRLERPRRSLGFRGWTWTARVVSGAQPGAMCGVWEPFRFEESNRFVDSRDDYGLLHDPLVIRRRSVGLRRASTSNGRWGYSPRPSCRNRENNRRWAGRSPAPPASARG